MADPKDNLPAWPDLIAEMGLLKRQVSEVKNVFSFTLPGVAAAEEQLVAAERRLGHPLDPMHREFLSYSNGWVDFYHKNSLLRADEIGQGDTWRELNGGLEAFYEAVDGLDDVPPREQIYPISFDPHGSSVFAIWLGGPVTGRGRPVLWLPWADTERYNNFFEFFGAVYGFHEEWLCPDHS
jgi:hypothetical protein